MIIDCHGHYTTAPAALEAWRKMQIDCGGDRAAMRGQDTPIIADDQIRESLEKTQLRLQRERGHYFDDTRRYIDANPRISDQDKEKIFYKNALKVFARLKSSVPAA
jgi:hypothetical protein